MWRRRREMRMRPFWKQSESRPELTAYTRKLQKRS